MYKLKCPVIYTAPDIESEAFHTSDFTVVVSIACIELVSTPEGLRWDYVFTIESFEHIHIKGHEPFRQWDLEELLLEINIRLDLDNDFETIKEDSIHANDN